MLWGGGLGLEIGREGAGVLGLGLWPGIWRLEGLRTGRGTILVSVGIEYLAFSRGTVVTINHNKKLNRFAMCVIDCKNCKQFGMPNPHVRLFMHFCPFSEPNAPFPCYCPR
jgi:hypothetical protein